MGPRHTFKFCGGHAPMTSLGPPGSNAYDLYALTLIYQTVYLLYCEHLINIEVSSYKHLVTATFLTMALCILKVFYFLCYKNL